MTPDIETLRCLERLHVRAWPALETADIDGWLWRWSGGGSQRANSVSTLSFWGENAAAALDRAEALYHAHGSPARFHTFEIGEPPALPRLLTARGYAMGESTETMMAIAAPGQPPLDVEVSDDPAEGWLAVYLGAITESRRAVNRDILRRVPDPHAYFSVRRGGRIVATALGVAHGAHAVAECVATSVEARGQGSATVAMSALKIWAASLGAATVGLQVVRTNAPAIRLYRRLGFAPVCVNRFWVKA